MTIGALYKKLRTDICDYGGKGVKKYIYNAHPYFSVQYLENAMQAELPLSQPLRIHHLVPINEAENQHVPLAFFQPLRLRNALWAWAISECQRSMEV